MRSLFCRTRRRAVVVFVLFALTSPPVFAGGDQEAASGAAGDAAMESEEGQEPLSVFVSVLPQQYFLERIAGERAEVTVLVPAGSPPATYDPTPRQVAAIGEADLWFRIGVPFENSFAPEIRANLPDLPIVDTRQGIDLRTLEEHSHGEEDHGDEHADEHHEDEHDHEHSGTVDPHIWLGTEEVVTQAGTIRDTLIDMDPEHAEVYREGYQAFTTDIAELRSELDEILEPLRGESFFVYHPSFGYFLEPFGINQIAIETGGGEPTPQQLQRLIERGQEEDIQVVFVQPEFSQTAAQRVAEALDAEVIEVNPLAPDWLANMRRLARRIEEGLE